MMDCVPFSFFFTALEQRKICHPQKIKRLGLFRELLYLGHAQAQSAEDLTSDVPLVRCKENEIAFFDIEFCLQCGFFSVGKELHDGRLPFAAFHLDEGESFRSEKFCAFRQVIDLSDGEPAKPLALIALTTPPASMCCEKL